MNQNTSSAVMAQCHDRDDRLNYFPTQPWATRALCEILAEEEDLSERVVWEPACGEGYMARPLGEYFGTVVATDVADYSATYPGQQELSDFMTVWDRPSQVQKSAPHWIITNPPFVAATEFIQIALDAASVGVAMFLRVQFLSGVGRCERLFSHRPPTQICLFSERVPLVKGRVDGAVSTATDYVWLVWRHGLSPLPPRWIRPCRKRLERPSDYAPLSPVAATPLPLFRDTAP